VKSKITNVTLFMTHSTDKVSQCAAYFTTWCIAKHGLNHCRNVCPSVYQSLVMYQNGKTHH